MRGELIAQFTLSRFPLTSFAGQGKEFVLNNGYTYSRQRHLTRTARGIGGGF